jgi:methylmalonyl-CoA mutase N-terminal domain/subunit
MEVAFSLAHTIATVEECQKIGLDPDDVVPRFWAHPHISMNFFEEIAKLRAYRRLWAKTFKERFGCKKPESLTYKALNAQTGGSELQGLEVLNNIIRTTIMALAGMLADVEGMWISSYDEGVGIPTEEAVQVCVRTYQILSEETDIPYVTDPLGGSYYIECLTNKIEEGAKDILKKIDELGGYLACWESGWLRNQVEIEAAKRFQGLQNGSKVKIGVTKYRVEEEPMANAYRRPPEAEERAVRRIKEYREERDQKKCAAALENLQKAAIAFDKEWPHSKGVLMSALLEAARCRATHGEMCRILQEVFGYGYFSG